MIHQPEPKSTLSEVLKASALGTFHTTDTHDAIVVGAGAAGGWAAMMLTEAGLRVLVLDASLPRARWRAPLRKIVGSVARRLSTPEGLSFLPPALLPKAKVAAKMLGRWRQPV